MKHKIRGRDGAIREAVDDYMLPEGEALVVEMPFIHLGRGPMIHDGQGNPIASAV